LTGADASAQSVVTSVSFGRRTKADRTPQSAARHVEKANREFWFARIIQTDNLAVKNGRFELQFGENRFVQRAK
jgi:hypothetical protein